MSNNKKVLSINGNPIKVNGNYVAIADTNLQDKVITPTAEPQVVMADEQYIGLNSVMVMSDDALVPENIKEGTSIFGVTGTYKATDVAFAIADGNTAPDTPSENMMWVQTDTEVSTFSIRSSIERPTDPTEGMVWVVNGQTSSGSFDILADENSLIVYPQKAYQYINGEWTARPIKIYKNGTWKDLFTATLNITYPEGAVCECTDGVITYTAPDRTGIWELIVPNPGTWITSGTEGEWEIIPIETLIDTDGESQNIELKYFEATINVTYPSGSCTCTCGSTSYSHSGGGTKTFIVNKAGTWAIKCTDEEAEGSSNITITTNGETKSVSISLHFFAIKDGASAVGTWKGVAKATLYNYQAYAMGISGDVGSYYRVRAVVNSNATQGYAISGKAINFSKYKTMKIKCRAVKNYAHCRFCIVVCNSAASEAARVEVSSSGTNHVTESIRNFTLNVSGITGSYYIGTEYDNYWILDTTSSAYLDIQEIELTT